MILGLSLGAFSLSLAFYSYLLEPIWLKVKTVPIPISTTQGKHLRIAHVSDLHWGEAVSHEYLKRAFKTIAAQKPDVILMTGDYVNILLTDREDYREALKRMTLAAPVYAIPGNHDGGEWSGPGGGYHNTDTIRAFLISAGIHYIENDFTCPEIKTVKVCLGGVGDWKGGFSHPEKFAAAFDSTPADFKILMLHNPDAKHTVKDMKWDLLLAGHTHGGQVTIPFVGSPWVRVQDTKELKGLFTYDGRPYHINPGIGNAQRRWRFNCRPEVSVLEVDL